MFSSSKKARRFIRRSLEGDPQAYLDLVEDGEGDLPTGLREGQYTVIGGMPDGLVRMGTEMGVHAMVIDPGPGNNESIPLVSARSGLDWEGDYRVLLFGRGPDAGGFFHYANRRGEVVLPVFTSPERASEFVEEHASANSGYLNTLRKNGPENFITPKRPVTGGLLKDKTGQVLVGGKLAPVVETLAVIAGGLAARYVVIDLGKPESRYMELPTQAA